MDNKGITARKSLTYYGAYIIMGILILAAAGIISICLTDTFKKPYVIVIFLGFLAISVCIYHITVLLKRVPRFSITKDIISVKGKAYALANITDINFTGKWPMGSMQKNEGMKIVFNGKEILYVYDSYYSNISEIKSFIERALQPEATTQKQYVNIPDKVYKGGLWGSTTLTSFIFAGAGLLLLVAIDGDQKWIGLFFLAMGFLFLVLHCHYFAIENGNLVVKKFAMPGYSKEFSLTDIKEVIFETGHKKPHGLCVIKNDYSKSTVYYAATLYNRHWREFKNQFEKAGIKVRDEIGITKI
jgi:hypothetical protein